MTPAIRSGNQPPSISLVMFAATKISSMTRKNPFTAATRSGLPFFGGAGLHENGTGKSSVSAGGEGLREDIEHSLRVAVAHEANLFPNDSCQRSEEIAAGVIKVTHIKREVVECPPFRDALVCVGPAESCDHQIRLRLSPRAPLWKIGLTTH
jgi:hypothetical protein